MTDLYYGVPVKALTKPEFISVTLTILMMTFWTFELSNGWGMLFAMTYFLFMPILSVFCSYWAGISIGKIYYILKSPRKLYNNGAYWITAAISVVIFIISILLTLILNKENIGNALWLSSFFICVIVLIPMNIGMKKYFSWTKEYSLPDVDYIQKQLKQKPTTPAK